MLFPRFCISKDDTIVRKKLFLIERQLSRKSTGLKKPLEELISSIDGSWLKELEAAVEEINAEETDENKEQLEQKKEFSSVSAALGGGKLTGYSYSQTGLDLTETIPDYVPKFFLRSTSIDMKELETGDASMDNSFSASQHSFYGMQNYERYKDMFQKEKKTKDYEMTGMAFDLSIGGHTLSVINNTRPPEKKKKVFFGGGSEGPYPLNVTSILPGSEKVYLDGTLLHNGGGYTINYSKGEITFSAPITRNNRVVVEYEVTTSGGAAPGKTTGFRLQTSGFREKPEQQNNVKKEREGDEKPDNQGRDNKLFSVKSYGLTYLADQTITYRPKQNGEVYEDYFYQTLSGIDGKFLIGGRTSVGFEYARSTGDKQRELGAFATQTFTIADTQSADLDPKGPYYLDETKLPIIEGSEEVRINGFPLEREKDYTLDYQYGHLKMKKEDLNLTALDVIEVRYRYLTEQDRINSGENVRSDSAYLLSVENEFGKLKHSYATTRYGKDFLRMGGGTTNQLRDEKHSFSYSPSERWSFKLDKAFIQNLDDRATDLRTTSRRDGFSVDYKGKAFNFYFSNDVSERYDSLEVRQVDDEKRDRNLSLQYSFNEAYSMSFKARRNRTENLRQGNVSYQGDMENVVTLNAKPWKTLQTDFSFTRGRTENNSASRSQNSSKKSDSYKLKYAPNPAVSVTYDLSTNNFGNTFAAVETSATDTFATGAFATSTQQGQSNGERNEKISFAWNPSKKFNFSTQNNRRRDIYAAGTTTTNQTNYDLRSVLSEKLDFQASLNLMRSARPTQGQKTDLTNITMNHKPGWLPEMVLGIGREGMRSDMESSFDGNETLTRVRTSGMKYSISAEPFWAGKKLKIERRDKTTRNHTNDTLTHDRETGHTSSLEVPFLGESSLLFDLAVANKRGSRPTRQESLGLTLNGKITALFDLSFSFKTADYTDHRSPEANTHDVQMNVVLRGSREW
ncbi:MAG: hypothetical protein AB1742_10245 [bacterium]